LTDIVGRKLSVSIVIFAIIADVVSGSACSVRVSRIAAHARPLPRARA
jgi:hypothetical protein